MLGSLKTRSVFLYISLLLILSSFVFASRASSFEFEDDDFFGDSSKASKRDTFVKPPKYRLRKGRRNRVIAKVDLSEQKMKVFINNRFWQEWKVSSGGIGHRTPTGSWSPTRLHEMWYSTQYFNTPMPHSVFFHQGYAVHATTYIGSLGRPASHGCVRLHPTHAKSFFNLVQAVGIHKTRIIVKK